MEKSDGRDTLARIAEAKLVCERKISLQKSKIDSLHAFYVNRFESVNSTAQQTTELQEKLGKLKGKLRKGEDDLTEAHTVRARKEAKRVAIAKSLAAMKEKNADLKRVVEEQRATKNKYAALISQRSKVLADCQEKCNRSKEHIELMEGAISWYNRALSFRIENNHGVKFIFTNISRQNSDKEYSFVIVLKGNTYNVLECNPALDTQKLVQELNKSNELFKFVRIMRQKFQEAEGARVHGSANDRQSLDVSQAPSEVQVSTNYRQESPWKKGLKPSECMSRTREGKEGHEVPSPGSRRAAPLKALNKHASHG